MRKSNEKKNDQENNRLNRICRCRVGGGPACWWALAVLALALALALVVVVVVAAAAAAAVAVAVVVVVVAAAAAVAVHAVVCEVVVKFLSSMTCNDNKLSKLATKQ